MLLPGDNLPGMATKLWDKVIHFICYGILTFLLLKGFYKAPQVKNYFFVVAVISIGYGIVLELFQGLIPGRGIDELDLLANSLGCIVAMIIFKYFGR